MRYTVLAALATFLTACAAVDPYYSNGFWVTKGDELIGAQDPRFTATMAVLNTLAPSALRMRSAQTHMSNDGITVGVSVDPNLNQQAAEVCIRGASTTLNSECFNNPHWHRRCAVGRVNECSVAYNIEQT